MSITLFTDQLYLGVMPRVVDAAEFLALNIRLTINMIFHVSEKIFSQPPFCLITLSTFDMVFVPMPRKKLWKGVKEALPVIERGEASWRIVTRVGIAASPWLPVS
jgi:hypothetical protein